jgi:hypothetical protein
MLALSDGVVVRGSYARRHTSTSTCSSRAVSNCAAEERYIHQDEMMQNHMLSQQHILGIHHVSLVYAQFVQFSLITND